MSKTLTNNAPPEVGATLQRLRLARGLTLEDLSRIAGVSKSMLSQIEREKANPTIATIFVYCSAAYMAYLALRNWTPPEPGSANASFTFLSGSIVHPLSPKTWMMATLAITQFADSFESAAERLLVVPLSFLVAQVFFAVVWCGLGVMMSRAFEQSIVMHRALILLTLGVIVWALLQ